MVNNMHTLIIRVYLSIPLHLFLVPKQFGPKTVCFSMNTLDQIPQPEFIWQLFAGSLHPPYYLTITKWFLHQILHGSFGHIPLCILQASCPVLSHAIPWGGREGGRGPRMLCISFMIAITPSLLIGNGTWHSFGFIINFSRRMLFNA